MIIELNQWCEEDRERRLVDIEKSVRILLEKFVALNEKVWLLEHPGAERIALKDEDTKTSWWLPSRRGGK